LSAIFCEDMSRQSLVHRNGLLVLLEVLLYCQALRFSSWVMLCMKSFLLHPISSMDF
jgi:hypothetical protein